MGVLRRTARPMVTTMCGVQLNDRKNMFMLGLRETMDQLAMANSVRYYGQVLRREDGHVLRRALDFEALELKIEGNVKEDVEKSG